MMYDVCMCVFGCVCVCVFVQDVDVLLLCIDGLKYGAITAIRLGLDVERTGNTYTHTHTHV